MSFDPAATATALLAARAECRPAGPLPPGLAPTNLAEAAAAQAALAELLGALPPAGFKIGATGARMQTLLGLSHPAAGFIAAANLHSSGARLTIGAMRGPAVECELAVRIGRDLPSQPLSLAEAANAIDAVAPAIELVENRYGPPPVGDLVAVGTPTLVADQVYHAAAVVGAWQDASGLDWTGIEGVLRLDGVERDRGFGAELQGHPLQGLAWLAGSEVVAVFGGLRKGQVIMLGSVTPSLWLRGGGQVEVGFTGLGAAQLDLV